LRYLALWQREVLANCNEFALSHANAMQSFSFCMAHLKTRPLHGKADIIALIPV
jgi:hypothetical protein